MNAIGNLLLGIAVLLFLGLLNLIYGNHRRTGDAGVGYAWVMLLVLLGFVVCIAIVTALIGSKGGFSWVGNTAGTKRVLLVLAGFIIAMWGVVFFSMGEGVGGLPKVVGYVVKFLSPIAILSVLLGAFLLLNEQYRSNLPTIAWRLPIYIALCIGLVPVGFHLWRKISRTVGVYVNIPASRKADVDRQLAEIEAVDLMKDGVFLYGSTDANRDKAVREAALAKIKSRPDWQEEMVRRLQNDWAPEAFTFLASNEVDDKAMFAEPLRQGVLIQARLIRENIRICRDKYDLYEGKFRWELERVLRTVDKFEGLGVDYRPAVQELRNALDEPVHFEKPKLQAIRPLDKWLAKH
jgi:hypothetical protein